MSTFCEQCKLIYDDDRNYCRICGKYLTKNSNEEAGVKCMPCHLYYSKGIDLCIHCDQPLELN
jgi:RNA polymerase subunit RPABC4/transcription elongation factor Spt4